MYPRSHKPFQGNAIQVFLLEMSMSRHTRAGKAFGQVLSVVTYQKLRTFNSGIQVYRNNIQHFMTSDQQSLCEQKVKRNSKGGRENITILIIRRWCNVQIVRRRHHQLAEQKSKPIPFVVCFICLGYSRSWFVVYVVVSFPSEIIIDESSVQTTRL